MTRARFFCYLCTGLWLGAFFFSLPVVSGPPEIARLISLGCLFTALGLALGFRLSSSEGLALPHTKLLAAAGLFWLVIFASVFTSKISFVAFIGACTFSLLPGSALIYLAVPEREMFLRICARCGGAIIAALALWVLIQHTVYPELLVHGQARLPFANPAGYAALLMLGFFPAMGFMLAARGTRHGFCALVLAALSLAAIVLLDSSGVLLALAGGLAVFKYTIRKCPQSHRAGFIILAVAALAAFLLPDILAYTDPGSHPAMVAASKVESFRVRTAIWRATAAMIAQHPFTGTGIGTFFLYYPQYRLPADTASGGFMAHCDPLQFWAEGGIAAPLLFYAFLIFAGQRMIAVFRVLPPESPERVMPAALFSALAALAVHAHIDFDLYEAPVLCVAGLLLGVWIAETGRMLQEDRCAYILPQRLPPNAGWALALLPAIGIIFVLQGFLLSEYDINRAHAYADRGDMKSFVAEVNRADRVGFHANARAYVTAASVPLDIVESPFKILPGDGKTPLYAQAEDLLAKAEARNPRLVAIPYYRARLARNRNDRAAEEQHLKQALVIDPAHLPSRVMLARMYNRVGDNKKALQVLKEALDGPGLRRGAEGSSDYFNILVMLAALEDDKDTIRRARDGLVRIYGAEGKKLNPQVPAR